MLDDGGRKQNIAIEVAQHPLGAGLGTIDADNAKMLRSDLLDARVNDAARLLQDLRTTARRAFTAASNGHSGCLLREKNWVKPFSLKAV